MIFPLHEIRCSIPPIPKPKQSSENHYNMGKLNQDQGKCLRIGQQHKSIVNFIYRFLLMDYIASKSKMSPINRGGRKQNYLVYREVFLRVELKWSKPDQQKWAKVVNYLVALMRKRLFH